MFAMTFLRAASVAAIGFFAFSPAAHADALSDAKARCEGQSNATPDEIISGCTALIQAGQYDSSGLALVYNNRGTAHDAKKDYDRAIADYSEAIRLAPDHARAFEARAKAYNSKFDYDRVIADYSEVIRLEPDNTAILKERAWIYQVKNDRDRAIADYTEVIRRTPGDAYAFSERGHAYEIKGDFERAIADFNEAVKLKPDYLSYSSRGHAYDDMGDYDRAIADYSEAIRLKPDDEGSYLFRGNAYRDKGDYERALADQNEMIRLNPAFAPNVAHRGLTYFAKGDTERAFADYNEAIGLKPDFALALYYRGVAYAVAGDWTRANADFEQAFAADRRRPHTLLWLHLSRAKTGKAGAGTLSNDAASLDFSRWPAQIVNFYLGRANEDDVRKAAAAEAGNRPPAQKQRNCEVAFYLGEFELLNQNASAARGLLQQAVDICPRHMLEYSAAQAEMKTLGSGGDVMASVKGYYDQLANSLPAWFPREWLPLVLGIVVGGILVLFIRRRRAKA